MKLKDLKQGDTVKHYVFGQLVEAKVTKILPNGVETEHEPIRWGREIFEHGYIIESSELQKKWGGTDKNGRPCKGPDTTPGAFFNNEPITI